VIFSFHAAMSGSVFLQGRWAGTGRVASPQEGEKQLNCLDEFELRGCCSGRGNLFIFCCLTKSTTHFF
jgi:hypothetical protein